MAKDVDKIPTLGEEVEELNEENLTEEPKQEEVKLQIVTNEQLIQFKLDNLSSQIQETDLKLRELATHVKSLVEILRKRK